MNNLKDILRSGRIVMFGYSDKNLPIDLNIQFSKINIYYINGNSSFSNKVKYLFNLINDVSNQKKSYLYND